MEALDMAARRRAWAAALLLAGATFLAGCGGAAETSADGSTEVGSTGAADVTVVLGEWIVEPTPASGTAGDLTITADNQGGEAHEVVIVRADDPADLPTDDDGAVDEAQVAEDDFIGEIEEFPNGEQRTGTFTLDAGTYVLFCNITETTDDGEVESHFAEGMSTTFEVE